MNEYIMRRGLSPEGKRIRQKHQGSLLNDEHGVTSSPLQKKIEKDFLKENVMRLKQIQAKCRNQESKINVGLQPIKAIQNKGPLWTNTFNQPIKTLDVLRTRGNERGGSAHSDYFSLSDELGGTDENRGRTEQQETTRESINCNPDVLTQDQECQVDLISNSSVLPLRPRSSNSIAVSTHPSIAFEETTSLKSNDINTVNNLSSNSKDSLLSQTLKNETASCKVSNIMTRIRNRKPACDTSLNNVWTEVQKNHIRLCPSNDALSVCGSTAATFKKNYAPSGKSAQNRPRSLDRALYNRSTTPSVKSFYQPPASERQSLISQQQLDYPIKKLNIESCTSPVALSNGCHSLENTSHLSESLPDLPKKLFLEDAKQSNLNSTNTKEKTCEDFETFTPTFHRKDLQLPMYRENALAKQRNLFLRSKSSHNLRKIDPPPTYKRGQVPKYLLARKAEKQRIQDAAAAVDPQCPPGHIPLPDSERRNTLHLLKKGHLDVLQQLSALPVAQDTLRVKNLKREFEAKLNQIEEGIEIFSQAKVYVINDE